MNIELYIDEEKKTFTAPYVPALAKRKFYEVEAKTEERQGPATAKEEIEEENELLLILTDIVFKKQFTIEQLLIGASNDYIYDKLAEAVFGKQKDSGEGNKERE